MAWAGLREASDSAPHGTEADFTGQDPFPRWLQGMLPGMWSSAKAVGGRPLFWPQFLPSIITGFQRQNIACLSVYQFISSRAEVATCRFGSDSKGSSLSSLLWWNCPCSRGRQDVRVRAFFGEYLLPRVSLIMYCFVHFWLVSMQDIQMSVLRPWPLWEVIKHNSHT